MAVETEIETDPARWLDVLAGSHDALVELVGDLSSGDLRHPSYCSKWSVSEVLSHLGSGAEIFKATLDAVVAGGPAPGPDRFPPIWDRWDAMTPEEQTDGFVAADGELLEALVNLGDGLHDLELTLWGRLHVDAAGYLGLRLNEHALHSWDVAVAFDPSATVAADAVALLVDRLPLVASRAGHAEAAGEDRPYAVTVETTGPVRRFGVSVTDAVGIAPVRGDGVGADVELGAEAMLRLVFGRLDPDHAPLVAVGQLPTVDRLRRVFSGF